MPALMATRRGPAPAETSGERRPATARSRPASRHARGRRQAAAPAAGAICGGARKASDLVRAAAAVELVHMATLVHDDVLDDAPAAPRPPDGVRPRRARDGDGDRRLPVLACVRAAGRERRPRAGAGAVRRLSSRSRAASLRSATTPTRRRRRERYLQRCELKTASLFAAACALGALAAGRGAEAVAALEPTAAVGLAFQMLDDVLDVSGPAERTGKHRGTDLLDGTVTLPLILAERRPGSAQLTCARSRRVRRRRRSAIASRRRARSRRHASARNGAGRRGEGGRCAATSTRRSTLPRRCRRPHRRAVRLKKRTAGRRPACRGRC